MIREIIKMAKVAVSEGWRKSDFVRIFSSEFAQMGKNAFEQVAKECQICPAAFLYKADLDQHMKTAHKGVSQ